MTTVNCLKCRELVTVPARVDAQALVQCPLCMEEFRLFDALRQLPPSLIVVEEPSANTDDQLHQEDGDGSAFVELDTSTGEQPIEAGDGSDTSFVPAFQFQENAEARPPTAAIVRSPRRRRPRAHPARQIVQVVLGGVAGIVLAQLILWWIPGSLSLANRDLTGFGRRYGHYVPFAVPASVRNAGRGPGRQSSARRSGDDQDIVPSDNFNTELPEFEFAEAHLREDAMASKPSDALPRPKRNAKADLGEAAPDRSSTKKKAQSPDRPTRKSLATRPGETSSTSSPDANSSQISDQIAGEHLEKLLDVDIPEVNMESPARSDPQPTLVPSPTKPQTSTDEAQPEDLPAMSEAAGVRGSPQFTSADVGLRYVHALTASVALDNTAGNNGEEFRRVAADFYRSLAGLGEALAYVDLNDAKVAEQIGDVVQLLEEIGSQPKKRDLAGTVAPSWMDNPRPHNGILLLGTVTAVESQGPYYATHIELVSKEKHSVTMVSRNDPREHLATGVQVMVLGALLDNPSKNLVGYSGDAARVVLDALHVVLDGR